MGAMFSRSMPKEVLGLLTNGEYSSMPPSQLDWLRIAIRKIFRMFTGSKFYGPIEFFLTAMAIDLVAPQYGKNTLKAYLPS